jgi:hypothetical protein
MRLGTAAICAALLGTAALPLHGQGIPDSVNTGNAVQTLAAGSKEIGGRPSSSGGVAWRPERQQAWLLLSSSILITGTEFVSWTVLPSASGECFSGSASKQSLAFSVAPT